MPTTNSLSLRINAFSVDLLALLEIRRSAYNFLIYLPVAPTLPRNRSLLVFLSLPKKGKRKINKYYLIWWMLRFMCEYATRSRLVSCSRGWRTDNGLRGVGKWKTLSISFVLLVLLLSSFMLCFHPALRWVLCVEGTLSLQPQDKFLDKQLMELENVKSGNLSCRPLKCWSRFERHDWNSHGILAWFSNKVCRLRIYYCGNI